MCVLSVGHLSHKLSNLQLLTSALIGSVICGPTSRKHIPQDKTSSVQPPLHPTAVGCLVSICNGLGLELKTCIFYPRRCATSSPAQLSTVAVMSSTVPSSTLSQIFRSCNGLLTLTRTSSCACCLFRRTRQDYNHAMRPNHLDRALIFYLFYLYVCLFVLYFIIVSRSR